MPGIVDDLLDYIMPARKPLRKAAGAAPVAAMPQDTTYLQEAVKESMARKKAAEAAGLKALAAPQSVAPAKTKLPKTPKNF